MLAMRSPRKLPAPQKLSLRVDQKDRILVVRIEIGARCHGARIVNDRPAQTLVRILIPGHIPESMQVLGDIVFDQARRALVDRCLDRYLDRPVATDHKRSSQVRCNQPRRGLDLRRFSGSSDHSVDNYPLDRAHASLQLSPGKIVSLLGAVRFAPVLTRQPSREAQ